MPHPSLDADHSWFKQLFELSPDPTWIIEDNRFVECNEAAIRALGYMSREEFLNVHPSKLSPPRQPDGEDSYAKAERMMAIAQSQGLHRFEWTHTKADGANFAAEVTLSAIELRDRKVMYCVWRDITEHKRLQDAILREKSLISEALDSLPGIFYVIDDQGRMLRWNKNFEMLSGYSSEEVRRLSSTDFFSDADKGIIADSIRKAFLTGETTVEADFVAKDQTKIPYFFTGKLVRIDEKPCLIGMGIDITDRKRTEEDLRHFRTAMDASADAIYLVDRASMRFVDVNEAACRMQNRTHAELLALGPDGVLSKSRDELMRTYDSIIAGGTGTEPLEMLRQREDGTQSWVELRRRAQRSGDGWMIVTTVRDITERKKAEQALHDSMEKLRIFADNVPALTVSWDENLRCRFANKAFVEFFGLGRKDVIGKHVREILGEDVYLEIEGYFAQALQGHKVTYERMRKLPNAEPRSIEIKLLPQIGDDGKVLGCFAVTTDITEHKLAEERIQRVAHHDSLTGLANRLLFNDRLNQAINLAKRNSRQVALLYLDLDKFKPVNDTLGHSAGDELLKGVAERLQRQVRESDTVARIGGDEFAVILPDIARREEAETVAKKIVAALGMPFQLGSPKQGLEIGTSIGIALYPADTQDADALIKAADAAMYCAKQAGKGLQDSSIVGGNIVGA